MMDSFHADTERSVIWIRGPEKLVRRLTMAVPAELTNSEPPPCWLIIVEAASWNRP